MAKMTERLFGRNLFHFHIFLTTVSYFEMTQILIKVARAVVLTQLVERSLAIPEVQSSNPVIGKIYIEYLFTVNCI